MRWRTGIPGLVVALTLAACAHDDASARRPAQPPPVAERAPASAPVAAAPVVIHGIRTASVRVAQAEDGAGAMVTATQPLAIDIDAALWTGRAADPVLSIGPLRFHHYEHPSPTSLRFVAADASALPRDAEVALQWGDDPASRVVVAASLP